MMKNVILKNSLLQSLWLLFSTRHWVLDFGENMVCHFLNCDQNWEMVPIDKLFIGWWWMTMMKNVILKKSFMQSLWLLLSPWHWVLDCGECGCCHVFHCDQNWEVVTVDKLFIGWLLVTMIRNVILKKSFLQSLWLLLSRWHCVLDCGECIWYHVLKCDQNLEVVIIDKLFTGWWWLTMMKHVILKKSFLQALWLFLSPWHWVLDSGKCICSPVLTCDKNW